MAISSVSTSSNQLGAVLRQQQSTDQKADLGLQDRNTTDERLSAVKTMQQKVIQNHGFEAKQATKDALTTNSKIINIPVQQRGSLIDISA